MNKFFTKIAGVALGLTLAIGVGVAVGSKSNEAARVSAGTIVSDLTFTKACGGSGTADDGTSWIVTSDGTESTFDSSKGIHYGTSSAQVGYIQLSTGDISGTVSKVVVNACAASGVTATVSVSVAGSSFGGSAQSLTTSAANYTFNGTATAGNITVRIEKPSKAAKALYCLSVKVTYTTGGGGGGGGVTYSKVTAAPSDWSGTYLLAYQSGNSAYVWTGVDANNCYEQVSVSNNVISASLTDAVEIEISSMSTGYSVMVVGGDNDGKYIYYGSYNNGLSFSTDPVSNSLSYNSGVVMGITYDAGTITMRFNSASNTMRFRYYKTGQQAVQLFKKDTTDPAIELTITEGTSTLGVGDTATVVATKINGATGTITWDSYDSHISIGTPETTDTTSTVVVTGVTGGEDILVASCDDCEDAELSFTVNKLLSSIAVTTQPTKKTYTEGESFDPTGMVVTATFNDNTTSPVTDYTYSPAGALTPSTNEITISYSYQGGETKSTTQAITVNAKAVDHIKIKTGPTKDEYHSGESFESAGLTITVCYNQAETDILDDVSSGFTLSPSTYTFDDNDEKAGSKEFTVTYGGKSAYFSVTVTKITGVLGDGGNYYIMHIDSEGIDFGMEAAVYTSSNGPAGIDLSESNELEPFEFTLVDSDTYTIGLGDDTNYLYTTNTNKGVRISETVRNWKVKKISPEEEGEYEYYLLQDKETGRYLTSFDSGTTNDFRCYGSGDTAPYCGKDRDSGGQHTRLMLVAEGAFAAQITEAILSNETPLCNNGASAPSVSRWNAIAGITYIQNELDILKETEAAPINEQGLTPTGTDAEKAMARYDLIMERYNTKSVTTYSDFLGRIARWDLPIKSSVRFGNVVSDNSAVLAIIIISVVGATAMGGYFFFRKKR